MMEQEYLHICEMEVYVSAAYYKESLFLKRDSWMLSMAPVMTLNVPDVMACSQLCLLQRENDIKCTAFNWLAGMGQCQLFHVDPNNATVLSSLVVHAGCSFVMDKN
ncbi:unnamed protein product [Lymnaea stagnalis]|uniref:Apple domain-containing protein n=1 Tax=Lymnaea stagnalis TaxID=6523 RepID=A0AAV2HBL1_LYMST